MTPTDKEQIEKLREIHALMLRDDPADAVLACERFNREYPQSPIGWNIASRIAMKIGDADGALHAIERAILIEPGNPDWQQQMAICLAMVGRMEDARKVAGVLGARCFDSAVRASAVGLLLSRLEMFDEAEQQFSSAAEKEPDNASHHYNLATALRARGDIGGAEKSLDRALSLTPDDPDALTLRSGLRKQTVASNHVATLEEALGRVEGQPRKQAAICYALAKELEDLDDNAASFSFLKKGSDIRRKHLHYDIDRDISRMAKIREVYNDAMFARGIEGFTDASPIFVIGMPCSGTTLVDRILGRHSVVKVAGELNNFLLQLVRLSRESVPGRDTSGTFLIEVSAGLDFEVLGKAYLGSIRAEREEYPFFVDKMPVNFLYAGLIHLALPKAKIIHMERDPMDTCYAVYKTQFEAACPYSYDLSELAEYYAAYCRLMAHWHRVLPGVMHTIRYEDLVTDTEDTAKEMLSYCDLSWEAECLRFGESTEYVTTDSTKSIEHGKLSRFCRAMEALRETADASLRYSATRESATVGSSDWKSRRHKQGVNAGPVRLATNFHQAELCSGLRT